APSQWAAMIKRYRASVMVAVPQQLSLLSQWAAAEAGVSYDQAWQIGDGHSVLWRWWRWRGLHRKLGWKFWAFVVGGASLPLALEQFWNGLGYAVVQGYGLTETAPAIAITNPFKAQRGAVGRTLAGVEMQIASDGEILVRGGNVSPGYYQNPGATAQAFDDQGWLHTGDLGRLDAEGNLHFLGRKKEVIVTAAGLNVYPDDVERVLARQSGIEECAAVEDQRGGRAQVHAVVVLRPETGPSALDAAVAAANAGLEPHQRISAASVWPQPHLPRTTSTHKLQRTAIARWVNQGEPARPETPGDGGANGWRAFLQQRWGIAPSRLGPQARLDSDLGLSSLDRVELWSWLEAHSAAGLDESSLLTLQTVGELEALLGAPGNEGRAPAGHGRAQPPVGAAPPPPPRLPAEEKIWPLRPLARRFRALGYSGLVFPVLHTVVTRITIEGAEQFAHLRRPVFFVANHQSLLDVPLILRGLPRPWRRWVLPAMGIEPYVAAFDPRARPWRRFRDRWRLRGARLFFGGYLLTPMGAIASSLRHTGRLADQGYCPLIFPEGARTPDGKLHSFRPGIGVFAAALRLPIVPIQLAGLYEILPDQARRARPGPARVTFGPVMNFPTESPEEITSRLESWFKIKL
ncbi:MAG: AMP-binding protein, partial [Terriglobales bacterium]